MTASTRTTVKALFETGDTLLEASFIDMIDSYLSLLDSNSKTFTTAGSDDFILDLAATLNASSGSGTFRGIKMNFTETDAAGWTTKRAIDVQVGGTTQTALVRLNDAFRLDLHGLSSASNGPDYAPLRLTRASGSTSQELRFAMNNQNACFYSRSTGAHGQFNFYGWNGLTTQQYISLQSTQLLFYANNTLAMTIDSSQIVDFEVDHASAPATKTPETDAPDDWLEIKMNGTQFWVPLYNT